MSGKQRNLADKVREDLLSIVTDALASVCVMADRYNIDNDSILKYLVDALTGVQNYETKYTKADRIRSMLVEELAELLTNMCDFRDSYGDLLKWLQSEAE